MVFMRTAPGGRGVAPAPDPRRDPGLPESDGVEEVLIREETAIHAKAVGGATQSRVKAEAPSAIAASSHRERPLVISAESCGQFDHFRVRRVDREHRSTLFVVTHHVESPSEAGMERGAAGA